MTALRPYVIEGGRFGRERLRLLSRVFAPSTTALLERAGLREGMTVLDLGCGGGDVTREIASRVGPGGRAVGMELDDSKLALARAELADDSRVTLVQGDARSLDAGGVYDLVYARFLLTYLAERAEVLSRIRRALVPGGVVVVEDIDFSAHVAEPRSPAFDRYVSLFSEVVRRRGGDADVGPKLPRLLVEAGFEDVGVSVVQLAFLGGEGKELAAVTYQGIAESVVAEGLASRAELDASLEQLRRFIARPDTLVTTPRVVQTWGRRAQ